MEAEAGENLRGSGSQSGKTGVFILQALDVHVRVHVHTCTRTCHVQEL